MHSPKKKQLLAIAWLLLLVLACFSCGGNNKTTGPGDDQNSPSDTLGDDTGDTLTDPGDTLSDPGDTLSENPPESLYTTLNWQGSSILYDSEVTKRDHSMLFVLASWCGACQRFKSETLTDSTVIQILGESFNIVQIPPDSDSLVVHGDSTVTCRQLAISIYQVRYVPTMIVLNRQGEEIGRFIGYSPPSAFAAVLDSVRAVGP